MSSDRWGPVLGNLHGGGVEVWHSVCCVHSWKNIRSQGTGEARRATDQPWNPGGFCVGLESGEPEPLTLRKAG